MMNFFWPELKTEYFCLPLLLGSSGVVSCVGAIDVVDRSGVEAGWIMGEEEVAVPSMFAMMVLEARPRGG